MSSAERRPGRTGPTEVEAAAPPAGLGARAGRTAAATGAPRGREAERRILEAACELLLEQPFARLRMEHVAARAGVGKTTIYRRWKSREELAEALLRDLAAPVVPIPDLGDTRAELLSAVAAGIRAVAETPLGPVLAALLSQIATNPALQAPYRATLVERRRQEFAAAIRRGIERGDLRDDTDPETAMELLVAPTYYRMLFGGTLDAELASAVVEHFLRANATAAGGGRG